MIKLPQVDSRYRYVTVVGMAPPKGFKHSLEARRRISDALSKRVQKPKSAEAIENMRIAHLGQKAWNKGLKGVQVSTRKGKKQPQFSGEKHWAWKGGITPINRALRNSLEYKLWREAVFERDNWTCVFCKKVGGWLEADHIKRWSEYPEFRYIIANGRTLCRPCHITTFKLC